MTRAGTWLLLLPGGLLAVSSAPLPADELEDEHALSMEFETPHTDWAQPYGPGKVRVLFFSDGLGTNAREIIELMQRFDVEAEAVYWAQLVDSPITQWHGGEAAHRRIARLLAEKWDCYLLNGVKLADLTVQEQYSLLLAVTQGAGIVLVGTTDDRVLKDRNRITDLPPFLTGDGVGDVFHVKQGRGIRLPARPNLDYHLGWETEYDYWQERLGRAALWAAGKMPEIALEAAVQAPEIRRSNLPGYAAVARWDSPEPAEIELSMRLTRDDGARIDLGSEKAVGRTGSIERRLPVLRAGKYHLDVFARSKRGVENWRTVPLTVTSPRKIAAVALQKGWGEVGETLAGTVAVEGEPAAAEEKVVVRLVDRYGRVLAQQELAPAMPPAFSFPVDPWLPMLLRVEAALSDGKGEVASSYAYFHVTKRNRGQWNFLVWDYPRGTLSPYAEESLRRLGMTVQLSGGSPPLEVAACDTAWVPYTTRILAPHDANGIMQPMCWNNTPAIDQHVQQIADQYVAARQHGVFVYSLGDETVTRGSCVDPACLAAYRKYLEQEYGDIKALNESWGAAYASFDEVQLSDPGDDAEAGALRAKNYPRWYDRQAYQCHNFVQLCRRFGEAYRKMDPQATTGFEGAGRLEDGDDFDLIIRSNGFWSPYPGPGDEIIRSIAPREFPRANWMGYTHDADSLLGVYWRMITRGMDAVWWWRWDNIGQFHGLLMPHLGPFPAVKEILKDTQIVRDGLGTLLLKSEMPDDGIALLYSMPSAYANRVGAGPSYGGYTAAHLAWYQAIRELGLQFRYVTDRQLRLGEFDPQRFRVLILAQAEAIGPQEAQAIRDFVNGGGHVIADVRPGLYDGHCKPLAQGALDDLFGIQRKANAQSANAAMEVRLGEGGPQAKLESVRLDPGIGLAGGVALGQAGETPVFIERTVGQGKVTLLNVTLPSLPALGRTETPEDLADAFQALFEAAGVRPEIKLTGADGRRLRNCELIRWRNGPTGIIALFREQGEAEKARVLLPRSMTVYDLRNRKPLGKAGAFTTTVLPRRASFFVLTDGPVKAPALSLDPPTVTRGQVAKLRIVIRDKLGLHAFRLSATRPTGAPAEWASQVVIVGGDGAEVALPVAFNDPAGTWQVEATDLYTDKPATAKLTVR